MDFAPWTRLGDSGVALCDIVGQARHEFGSIGALPAVFRGDATREAVQVRAYLMEAREAMELVHANARGEFLSSKAVLGDLLREAAEGVGGTLSSGCCRRWRLSWRRSAC